MLFVDNEMKKWAYFFRFIGSLFHLLSILFFYSKLK